MLAPFSHEQKLINEGQMNKKQLSLIFVSCDKCAEA